MAETLEPLGAGDDASEGAVGFEAVSELHGQDPSKTFGGLYSGGEDADRGRLWIDPFCLG